MSGGVRSCRGGVSFLRTLGGSLEANELEVDGGDAPQELMEGEPIDGEQVVEGDVTRLAEASGFSVAAFGSEAPQPQALGHLNTVSCQLWRCALSPSNSWAFARAA